MTRKTIVDATGLKCPLPVLKAQKILRTLPEGSVIQVLATDGNAPSDFEDLCRLTNNSILESLEVDGVYHVTILKES